LIGSPDVHSKSGIALRPRISVGIEDSASSILLGGIGIRERASGDQTDAELIQAVLVSGDRVDLEAGYGGWKTAIVSQALRDATTTPEIEWMTSATKKSLHDLRGTFGVRPWTRPVLASSSQASDISVRHRGAVIDGRMVVRDLSSHHVLDSSSAAIHFGSIWWGGGCRIVGSFAAELTRALIFGAALHAVSKSDESVDVDRVLHDLERSSLAGRIHERITGAFGRLRQLATTAIAVSIVRRMVRASDNALIASLTQALWGKVASSEHIATELHRRGVSLEHFPRALRRSATRTST
jgi:hypothetical protein